MFLDRPGSRPAISFVRFVAPGGFGEEREQWLRRTQPKGVPLPGWLPIAPVPPPPNPGCLRPGAPDPEEANAALRHTLDAIGAAKLREPSAWWLARLLHHQFAPASAARPSGAGNAARRLRDVRRAHTRLQEAADLLGSPPPPMPDRLRPKARIGPFTLAVPSQRRVTNPPAWETSVLYGAAYAARVATGSENPLNYRKGLPMPEGGRPLYAVAAAFLRDLSGIHLEPFDAAKRVHDLTVRNPHFRWWGWTP